MQSTRTIEQSFHDPFPCETDSQTELNIEPRLLPGVILEAVMWDFEIEWPGHAFGD